MEKYPQAQLKAIKLDHTDHGYVYKVKGLGNGEQYEIKVHANTKDIIEDKTEKETDPINPNKVFKFDEKIVDWKEAMKKALDKVGATSFVKEWELSMENGKLVYEFDVKNDDQSLDVVVDAYTGEVLELDQ